MATSLDLNPDAANDQFAAAKSTFPIVGLGASAGGLEAIEHFFDEVRLDSGAAYVLVQHLSPDFKSLMDELLPRHTRLPIHRVQDGMPVEPNAVYLIPPKKNMTLSGGRLMLADQEPGLNLPIDIFFRSLAQDAGSRAIAVVLSGTGSDGSRGAKAVHEARGLVLVQDPETAAFDGMPRAALATGAADAVLAPSDMPGRILQHLGHPSGKAETAPPADKDDALGMLFESLRRRFGIDFTLYKPGTIARRLERRMALADIADLKAYVEGPARNPAELDALYRDFLVEVTQFFRDPDAFEVLRRKAIPDLCEKLKPGETIRVWTPGCATGEEAYSLAMLFREEMKGRGCPQEVTIFATDVHRASLDTASLGTYPAEALEHVPAAFRERYFVPRGERFAVNSDLRQMVIFAPHNLTKDPPFTKLDFICCRNLLIYLNPQIQRKILTLFHFGLNTGGILFLGPSETAGELDAEFETVDAHWKVFRKRRDVRLLAADRLAGIAPLSDTAAMVRQRLSGASRNDSGLASTYEALLARFVPSGVLVSEQLELLHVFGDAGRYLAIPTGKAGVDVLRLASDGLRMALSAAVHRAQQSKEPVVYHSVPVGGGSDTRVRVSVTPLPDRRSRTAAYYIALEEETPPPTSPDVRGGAEAFDVQGESAERIGRLERELANSQEHLQSAVEELETSNEELQSTNEELVASNEELQSTNEELHSVNEELYTVNAEHQRKIEELVQLTTDMDNLLASTAIGTLFIDSARSIRKFTPTAAEIFNLLPQDVGRPLKHISNNIGLSDEELSQVIERVLSGGEPTDREIAGPRGRSYLMRVLPYRTQDGEVTGAVLTFIDVSAIKEAHQEIAAHERRLRLALEVGDICIWEWDVVADQLRGGARFAEFFGNDPAWQPATLGEMFARLAPDDRSRVEEACFRALEQEGRMEVRYRVGQGEHTRHVLTRIDVDRDPDGRPWRMLGVSIDVTEQERMQAALHESRELLRAILDNSSSAIFAKDLQGKYLFANDGFARLFQRTSEELAGHTDGELVPAELASARREADLHVLADETVLSREETWEVEGGPRHLLVVRFPLRDPSGRVQGLGGIATDVTALKTAEHDAREAVRRRDQFLAGLSHELRNPLAAILNATFLLASGLADRESCEEAQQIIRRQAEQMARLLDDLLDVSRYTQNKLQLKKQAVDLAQIVAETVRNSRAIVEQAGLNFETQLPAEPLPMAGDPTRLQQMVTNLLHNATKYTPRGGAARLTLTREGEEAVLAVRDTGVGIAPEMLDKIFELFVQADETRHRSGTGMGVGLTLVRTIAEMHGGSVAAASGGPNQGSEFTIRLPLSLDLPPIPAESSRSPAAQRKTKGATVVLVEDNQDSRTMLETLLRHEGCETIPAGDGHAGAAAIIAHRPRLALVDIGLPGQSGVEVARQVRRELGRDGVYLVALTGYGTSSDREEFLAAGFDEHLVKPLRYAELSQLLARAL